MVILEAMVCRVRLIVGGSRNVVSPYSYGYAVSCYVILSNGINQIVPSKIVASYLVRVILA